MGLSSFPTLGWFEGSIWHRPMECLGPSPGVEMHFKTRPCLLGMFWGEGGKHRTISPPSLGQQVSRCLELGQAKHGEPRVFS